MCVCVCVCIFRVRISYTILKNGIIVITQNQGGAEVECNNNDIIQVIGDHYNFYPNKVKTSNYVITSCLVNKHISDEKGTFYVMSMQFTILPRV